MHYAGENKWVNRVYQNISKEELTNKPDRLQSESRQTDNSNGMNRAPGIKRELRSGAVESNAEGTKPRSFNETGLGPDAPGQKMQYAITATIALNPSKPGRKGDATL